MRRLAAALSLALVAAAPRAADAAGRPATTGRPVAGRAEAVATAAGRDVARRPVIDMARIPAGRYLPLYGEPDPTGAVRARHTPVAAFRLDRTPVTRGDYLTFVRERPRWRRSAVRPLFAGPGYLADWAGDLAPGAAADLARPVTRVSWFAARAYCAWRGARLPTVDEWEYAAAASATRRDAGRDPAFVRQVLAAYVAPRGPLPAVAFGFAPNAFGVRALHGLVWEWTHDFNGVLVSDDSRGTGSGVREGDRDLWCASGALGATDPSNYPAFLRYAFRAGLSGRTTTAGLGFRCAA